MDKRFSLGWLFLKTLADWLLRGLGVFSFVGTGE